MERFNYPSIAAVRAESAEILRLLATEALGSTRQDEINELKNQIEGLRSQYGQ